MAETFLVVDDSKLARMVVRQALRDLHPDCAILEAATGPEADRVDGVDTLSAAFIDFNMPDEDGLELAARLRARRPDLPIAIISANAQTDVLERARDLGAAFLEKPVSRDALAGFVAAPAAQRRSA
ncbi:response regulator transcription factor [Azospirillum sp.]|uniref:response regulator transcription factor n=1 Tax=Azospirillum sp. TaxID=34012 RepID=UPI003D71646D